MRRTDREVTDFESKCRILESLTVGHLAMIDGARPFGVTINYLAEISGETVTLYFHGAKTGRKAKAFADNPNVYFFAERDGGAKESVRPDGSRSITNLYVSVSGEGAMEPLDDPAEKNRVLLAMANQYAQTPFESIPQATLDHTAVWRLVLTHIVGKSNPPYGA